MQQLDLFSTPVTPVVQKKTEKIKNTPREQPAPEPAIEPVKKQSKRGRKSHKETYTDVDLLDIPDDEILFSKQYYPINEVAVWFSVNPSVLRFWEKNFPILKPKKNGKGDRYFRPEDVKNLRIIYYLLRQQKYSIEGARKYLKENHDKASADMQLVETLTKCRDFLTELRTNLGT